MDRSRWDRIQAVFHRVADVPPDQQHARLLAECDGDESLAAAVQAMLTEDERAASFLERELPEVAHAVLDQAELPLPNTELGQYRLLKALGEGGMGVVYLAEHRVTGGRVAVKILHQGWLSPARRERFAEEQRILARLNHPLIARIYDSPVPDHSVPWFAMEYVDGLPINEYCRRQDLSIEQCVDLFRSVCEAVQTAHAQAIIHRDLKPSNILVKADGKVKLLDFGIAKRMEGDLGLAASPTQTGFRPLTPTYASPEQIRGDGTGTQTDVYSLGVILFELLTQTLPLDVSGKSLGEAEQIFLQQEPAPPSTIVRHLKLSGTGTEYRQLSKSAWSELDVLCLTALHKDLRKRYSSVEALIADIDHYRKGEPLNARPDTLGYRTHTFLRRNRRALSVTIAVLAMMAALVTFVALRLAQARATELLNARRIERVERFMLNLFDGGDATAGPSNDLKVVGLLDRGVKTADALKTEPRFRQIYTARSVTSTRK